MSDDYFSKCPECGSRNVQIERCPNGRTECKDCGLKRLHERWIELHQQKGTQ